MRKLTVLAILIAGIVPAAAASPTDYPADRMFTGKPVLPDFNGRDRWAREYRTRLNEGARAGANFAGHYAVVEIGCGTSCSFAYVIDVEDGRVFEFPYGGEENYGMRLGFSVESRLMTVSWLPSTGASFDKCVIQDIVWNGKVEVVDEKTVAADGYCPD